MNSSATQMANVMADGETPPELARIGETTHARCDDAGLLERIRRGDERAFEELVEQHSGAMLAIARRLLGNEDDARDAVHVAFISAFEGIDRFHGSAKLSTWLHRIIVNSALMKLRRRRRKPEESIEGHLIHLCADAGGYAPDRCAAPSDELVRRRQDRILVRRCIERLPDVYRRVLLLRDIEERETHETASLLQITPNAVKIRLYRARQALRKVIAETLGQDDERLQERSRPQGAPRFRVAQHPPPGALPSRPPALERQP